MFSDSQLYIFDLISSASLSPIGRWSQRTLRATLLPMYSPAVLDHFKNPRNAGELADATASVQVENPVCGDVLRLAARAEEGKITAVRFKAQGCVAAMAAASVLTELMAGKTASEARKITPEQIANALGGLPAASFHAAQLAFDALASLLATL